MPARIRSIRTIPVESPFSDPPFDILSMPDRKLSGGRDRHGGNIEGWRMVGLSNGDAHTILTTNTDPYGIHSGSLSEFIDMVDDGVVYVSLYSYDIDILLKTLGKEVCEDLVYRRYATTDTMRIWYRVGQSVTIRKQKKTVRFLCLSKWAPSNNVNALLDAVDVPEPSTYTNQADAAKVLSMLIANRAHKIYQFAPGDLISPAAITNELLTATINNISLESIPIGAQQMAYEGLHAPWVETFQRGFFPSSWDYDLTSAYPQELRSLLDIGEEYGSWRFVDSFQPSAKYGFYRARINIPHSKSKYPIPIRYRIVNTLYTVTGDWIGYINQQEIEFLRKHNLGDADVLYGWTFFPVEERYPFRKVATRMILMRSMAKHSQDKLMSTIIKNALVRITGKFLQRYQNPNGEWITSPSFCPIYANIAMTNTKLRLAETLLKYENNVIAITTDGFLLNKPLTKKDASEFRVEAENVPSVYVAPALYNIPGKSGRFDAIAVLEDGEDEEGYLIVPYDVVISLCDAITSDKFSTTGIPVDSYTKYPLNDIKREWDGFFMTADAMLKDSFRSKPYQVDEISIYSEAYMNGIPIPRY